MKYPINIKNLNNNIEFYLEVVDLVEESKKYLKSFSWCHEIKKGYLYTNIGRVFCIFLYEIINTSSPEDNFNWVVVGDIPPMYLDIFGAESTVQVISNYVELAQDWINQIRAGNSVDECYPFDVEPTIEFADLLEKKISFMKSTLIFNINDIPFNVNNFD